MPDFLYGLRLVEGPFPVVVTVLGVAALIYLLIRRTRRWPLRLGIAVLAAGIGVPLTNWLLVNKLEISATDLPLHILAIIGITVFALALAVFDLWVGPLRRRILSPIALLAVVLTALLQTNMYYDAFPTAGALVGGESRGITPLPDKLRAGHGKETPTPLKGESVASTWHSPSKLPTEGRVFSAQIPGETSHFTGQTSYVYLPPAYFASPRPHLPVLILLTGQPGTPSQWLSTGQVKQQMDRFAKDHGGLAPVVVMPEVNGDQKANLMCMDSDLSRSGTFISQDLPSWIKRTLTVDPDPKHWIIGGFSWGGTCTSQMTALHPEVYPNGMVFHGELEPALTKDREQSVQKTFGGDTAKFDAQTPLSALAATPHPDTWLFYSSGATDKQFMGHMTTLSDAARQSGAHVAVQPAAGVGHSWKVIQNRLRPALDWFAQRVGLTAPKA